ncbi:MAG: IS66 family transposase [Turicibacter sp.]
MGCWAHARRKFKDVPGKNGKAKQAIDYCNQIFKIERELQELSPEERYEQRQLQVKPVIEAFYDFLGSFIPMKGKLQTAVHYVLNQKQQLMTFLKDGRLEASNNRAERTIKTVVFDEKTTYFQQAYQGLKPMRLFIASSKRLRNMA